MAPHPPERRVTAYLRPVVRALQRQVRELQRLLGKKKLEAEILKQAFELAVKSGETLRYLMRWLFRQKRAPRDAG
jgi:hypothetical protein